MIGSECQWLQKRRHSSPTQTSVVGKPTTPVSCVRWGLVIGKPTAPLQGPRVPTVDAIPSPTGVEPTNGNELVRETLIALPSLPDTPKKITPEREVGVPFRSPGVALEGGKARVPGPEVSIMNMYTKGKQTKRNTRQRERERNKLHPAKQFQPKNFPN